MRKNNVKVSIIVPVYNVEKYIDKCLSSLVNQTLKDIEIIVVNDGTKDNSQKIVDKYVKKYPKMVKSYIKENGGQGSARNYGLEKAIGEYIGYVDSDDYVDKQMFEKLYNKAYENNLDVVACCNIRVSDVTNEENLEPLFNKMDDIKTNFFFGNIGVCNKIYKNEIIKDLKFKTQVWYEDVAYTCKAIMKAKNFGIINEGLYYYLTRQGSTMNNNNIVKNLDILSAFDDILYYINLHKEYTKYYDEIEYLAIYHILITATVRVINIKTEDKKEKRKIINEFRNYILEKFPNYQNNKYLYLLDLNKKIIYNLVKLKQYWLIKLIFTIKGA